MFALIQDAHKLSNAVWTQSLVSGPDDLPPGPGEYGGAVGTGDLWGDYSAVGLGSRGAYCAPEMNEANTCS
ncbi:hypothetical protein GUITHDRAFT_109204 [Guillardia theta CCMP2712]|uniref:Uncharacterized protein n=1 Tax=Guillardia theta (strain CCMP2712) TaxID=905079 RepID=L1J9M2_GUITC|nr:hypothetical protein GUITHDRAFT_109204 [Guillardia theta CCMP2712]EKX44779.1 hypothetical protein GUITHDRAFT_109204 [Guillardia theta CCMP2712]|eukprot:XP_005831759.1 hypothetical protein GUITHDRAFT_109204 [Guillardia theta CCMP2712]